MGMTSVAKTFAKRPLQQRIIALAAAYAIALASLIASFGALLLNFSATMVNVAIDELTARFEAPLSTSLRSALAWPSLATGLQ